MRTRIFGAAILIVAMTLPACQNGGTARKSSLKSVSEKVGYSIGMDIGKSLMKIKDDVDIDSVSQGLKDLLEGREDVLLSPDEAAQIMQEFARQMQEKQMQQAQEAGSGNKVKGEAFIKANATAEGVQTTASGLQYKIEREGKGPKATADDKVSVHYRGSLIDGTVFDSSYERGNPVTFAVSGVIPGWTEGLQMMNAGAKYMLYIPSDLAYGERGAGGRIGPNETLIFEVELLSIEK